jgi:hypothetical protein
MNDKTVYSYINDIAQRLKEPRKYGDVSLMVGAGFSKNAQSKGMVFSHQIGVNLLKKCMRSYTRSH